MFILDNILASPMKGFLWIARELHRAADAESEDREQALTDELSKLYMELETGQISAEEFDEQERDLLDRLDALAGKGDEDGEAEDEDDEDLDDDEDDDDDDDDDAADDADVDVNNDAPTHTGTQP